ncbi:MAG: hypothetical protein Q8K96_04490, partial [Rubrivivax sp.]|nr:hypothetical protein [Rubrivivax sp.]
MALMDTINVDRDVAVRRNATGDHPLRWPRRPSPNSISGPSNWVIILSGQECARILGDGGEFFLSGN